MKVVILDPYFESLGGGEKVVVVLAEHLAKKNQVTILVKNPVDVPAVNSYFDVDLSNVRFETLPKESFLVRTMTSRHIKLPGRWKSIIYDRGSLRALKKLQADLFINSLYQSNLPSPAPKSIYLCMFPQKLEPKNIYHSWLRKLYNQLTTALEKRLVGGRQEAVDSYSLIAANSNYTAGWIKRYWGRDAAIVYPVCDDMGPPAVKKNFILTVGRFFADNGSSHHKRHDELIKAFVRLDQADWELHLAGSVAEDEDSKHYFRSLQKLAGERQNIFIHPNMPFADIKKLRQESAIYWHATGYGYDADIFPENQEHFGMVTAEAMSAGAVPVVYNSAGQTEVVEHGKNGFLWKTIDEMLADTERLMGDEDLRQKMAGAAIKRAQDFNRPSFLKQIDQLILKVSNGES